MCSFLDGILACLHFIPLHSLARDRSSPNKLTCVCYAWEFMGKSSSESALIRKLMWKEKENFINKIFWRVEILFFQFTKRGHHNNSNNNNDSWKKRVQKGFLVPFSYTILARLTRIRSVLFFSAAWGFSGLPLFADIAALWVVCDHSELSFFRVFQF